MKPIISPQHEAYLRSLYMTQPERDRKARNVGRLILASLVIVPAVAAMIYRMIFHL